MEINERIRKYRDSKKMTREVFGSMFGVSGDVVNNMERGRAEITEDRILLILKTFPDLSEEWLRFENGDMKKNNTRSQEIGNFVSEIMDLPDDSVQKQFMTRFVSAIQKLDENDLSTILSILNKIKGSE